TGVELIQSVAIQKDGGVVMAGGSHGDFFLMRLRSDGKLDTSFGVNGKVRTNFIGDNDDARAVTIQPDGKIIAVGGAGNGPLHGKFAIARYLPNGKLDHSFSGDGKRTISFADGGGANAVVVQADGKILIAGTADIG